MAYYDEVMADSPTYYLPLDSLTVANEGSGTNAIAVGNTVTLGGPGIGDTTASMQFDGASANVYEFVRIDSALAGATQSVTVELWCKGTVKNTNPRLAYHFNDGAFLNLQMDSAGRPSVIYGGHPNTNKQASSTKVVQDGEWHHLAMTASGGTLKLYVDGVLESTVTGYTGGTSIRAPLWIGQSGSSSTFAHGTASRIYQGLISQVAMYDGVALTPGRILAHYNAGVGVEPALPVDVSTGDIGVSLLSGFDATIELGEAAAEPVAVTAGSMGWLTLSGYDATVTKGAAQNPPKSVSSGTPFGLLLNGFSAKVALTAVVLPPKFLSSDGMGELSLSGYDAQVELSAASTPLELGIGSAGLLSLSAFGAGIEFGEAPLVVLGTWFLETTMFNKTFLLERSTATQEVVNSRKAKATILKVRV